MKIKTSITLSEDLFKELDNYLDEVNNRSLFIEKALLFYLESIRKKQRNKNDFEKINKLSESLNKEAVDVLLYQADL